MEVENIKESKEKARQAWREWLEVNKKKPTELAKTMKAAYKHLAQGRCLIDVFEVMKRASLNDKGEPKLAIARADWKFVQFGTRWGKEGYWFAQNMSHVVARTGVQLPIDTFEKGKLKSNLQAPVPPIPAEYCGKAALKNYYVLWDCKDWKTIPSDPLLLKRISNNLFAVLFCWDLSPLERAIISGKK